MEFYYSAKPLTLKISASPDVIISIDFNNSGKHQSEELPYNVEQLFNWFDGYACKKIDPSFKIIMLNSPEELKKPNAGKNTIVLDMSSYTNTEIRVYRELMKVAPGKTVSYGELAAWCGIPHGGRFIGNAMAKNRFPVLVPCHRVIRSDGSTGNYSGGVGIKQMLLEHESGGFSPARL